MVLIVVPWINSMYLKDSRDVSLPHNLLKVIDIPGSLVKKNHETSTLSNEEMNLVA
jgi:hypothetical protein